MRGAFGKPFNYGTNWPKVSKDGFERQIVLNAGEGSLVTHFYDFIIQLSNHDRMLRDKKESIQQNVQPQMLQHSLSQQASGAPKRVLRARVRWLFVRAHLKGRGGIKSF